MTHFQGNIPELELVWVISKTICCTSEVTLLAHDVTMKAGDVTTRTWLTILIFGLPQRACRTRSHALTTASPIFPRDGNSLIAPAESSPLQLDKFSYWSDFLVR